MKNCMNISRAFIASLMLGFVGLTASAAVAIRGSNGVFTLEVNGKPYFIRGAGGGGDTALLKKLGGNSFRTWGAGNIEKDLAEAKKYGLTVMCGFWLGHAEHGFDYQNQKMNKRVIVFIGALFVLLGALRAEVNEWNGGEGLYYADANWSLGHSPTATEDILITGKDAVVTYVPGGDFAPQGL